ncbi:MAG: DUF1902 domain-containing protein [Betaproteobacteria bacterium]|nr:DUF1902 domain-containing protein [Betaproteobacteria bacterium]
MVAQRVRIAALWDDEAQVWVAQSDDVPGLVCEAPTIPDLMRKLERLIPELLDENGYPDGRDVEFELAATLHGVAHREAA